MSITWTVDAANRRVHITVVRPVNRDQARDAIGAIASQPGFESSFAVVIETIGESAPAFVRDVMYMLSTHRAKFQGARVAVVLGLGVMHAPPSHTAEIMAQWTDLPMEVRTFATHMAAERWLSGR